MIRTILSLGVLSLSSWWCGFLMAQENKPLGGLQSNLRPLNLGGPIFVAPDPDSKSALIDLLSNDSIVTELRLTPEHVSAAFNLKEQAQARLKELGRPPKTGDMRAFVKKRRELGDSIVKETDAAFEELFLPAQKNRLKQLTYHVEVARIGMGPALTEGRLGKDIGVAAEQKQSLAEQAWNIELQLEEDIYKLRAAAQARILAELSAEQRTKTEQFLGKYFRFEDLARDADRAKEAAAQRRLDVTKKK